MNKLQEYFWAYRNKITNKLFGVTRMPAKGKKKGEVLISYINEPFTVLPSRGFSNFHTMYWECYEIARLFSERGYACDIVNNYNDKFIPKKKYTACFDSGDSFDRWAKFLPKDCKKIYPILMSNWQEYNEAERIRLQNLKNRRGLTLSPRRTLKATRNPELADYLVGFGNKSVFSTFAKFNKPIFFIPISSVVKYDFPLHKDWEKAKKNFLWIGGGGLVLKGLDLVLEVFKSNPDLTLHVCGPVQAEKDFATAYEEELNRTPNIHPYGRLDVAGLQFKEIINFCGAVIYPSGGDGTSGAIVQAMHAGLVPLISNETGVQEDYGYTPITDPTPQAVEKAVRDFSNLTDEQVKQASKKTWLYANRVYTREEFSKAYGKFMDEVLKI